jgi:hypothetical protein
VNDSPWSVDVDWGDGSAHTTFSATTQGSFGSKYHTYADNGALPYTVTVKVTDKDGGVGTATFKVTVSNVAPTVTTFTGTNVLYGPLVFGLTGSFSGSFYDPGLVDYPWTLSFNWDGNTSGPTTQVTTADPTGNHAFSVKPYFTSAGCTKTATVTVTDKDGGVGTKSATISVGMGNFLPPMTNQPVTDQLKNGQVLPVKVQIADCNGNPINGLSPSIGIVQGDQTTDVADNTLEPIAFSSVSSADTTGVMRQSGDGSYIYNLRINFGTSSLPATYTVVITPNILGYASTLTLRHKLYITK